MYQSQLFGCHLDIYILRFYDQLIQTTYYKILDTDKSPLDLYCLCETFVTPKIDDNYLKINGYSIVRRDRIHKKGGGVMIYIRNGINFHHRHDLEDKFIEMIRIEIKYTNKSIL